ncbi:MAG: DMT family transporter [Methanomicrobiaceae archaeon]|nr:DMT family transporter [Methanomicrobiaceae archaeon]
MRVLPALAGITLAEATIGVFVKLVGPEIPVLTLNFYTVLFAAVFFMLALTFGAGRSIGFPRDNLKDTLIIGVLIATQLSLFNIAMTLAPIANVVIFWSVAPFFTFIFSTIFLGEEPRKTQFFIFILAIIGVVIAKPLEGGYALGNAIALSTGVTYAMQITYMRHEGKEDESEDIFWSLVFASVFLFPAVLYFGPGDLLTLGPQGVAPVLIWAACLGMFSRGLSYYLIATVLNTINANIYSLVDVIVSPLFAAVFGWIIFSEVPTTDMIIGGSILIGSGFLLTWTRREETERAVRELGRGT